MIRSTNWQLFKNSSEGTIDRDFDFESWVNNPKNIMWEEGSSIGLATYEYPGVYSLHWFYTVRGKEAMALAREMVNDLFTNHPARAVRGLTPVKNRAARLAARWLGMKSYGILTFPEGDHELFCMTKEEFYE